MDEPHHQNYRFPAEWEPHASVWLSWPTGDFIEGHSVEKTYLEIVVTLTRFVHVSLLVQDANEKDRVSKLLRLHQEPSNYGIALYEIAHFEIWMRDFGPIFLQSIPSDSPKIVQFEWTNWGYQWNSSITENDGHIPSSIVSTLGIPWFSADICSEGGDREFNGKGTMIVCEEVELQRNPSKSKDQIEESLKKCFNLSKIIWVKRGVAEDDHTFNGRLPGNVLTCNTTGGHVDEVFCEFVGPSTILLAEVDEEEAKTDPISAITRQRLEENLDILRQERDQDGNLFEIIRIPMPPTIRRTVNPSDNLHHFFRTLTFKDGTTVDANTSVNVVVPGSYCNFLISNGVVLMAKYYKEGRDLSFLKRDREAGDLLKRLFPHHNVIQLDVESVNFGGGGIHCITQQQPA